MRKSFYANHLKAKKLREVYAVAGQRVQQYLQAEVDCLAAMVGPAARVFELGCGYGRVLAQVGGQAVGSDLSIDSLRLGRSNYPKLFFALMDAAHLGIVDNVFDIVFGVQNFISICRVPPSDLLREALRVTRPGGRVVLASYTRRFWPHRLAWFRRQAEAGLLGPIDEEATGDGVIVCQDGFRATRFGRAEFSDMAAAVGVSADIYAVDGSSLFCEVIAGNS